MTGTLPKLVPPNFKIEAIKKHVNVKVVLNKNKAVF